MSDAKVAVPNLVELVTPVLTGEWLTWDEDKAEAYSAQVHLAVEVTAMLRQRHDEQVDTAQTMGKFGNVKRIRKARTTEDTGPKVDPLVAALAQFGN